MRFAIYFWQGNDIAVDPLPHPLCPLGNSSRSTSLFWLCRGEYTPLKPLLLSGDAYSVFSAIWMVRARLAGVCVREMMSVWKIMTKWIQTKNLIPNWIFICTQTCTDEHRLWRFAMLSHHPDGKHKQSVCESVKVCDVCVKKIMT